MSRYRNRCRCRRNGYEPCNREEDDDNVIIIPDVPFVPVIGERSPAIFGWSRYEPVMQVYRNTMPPPFICGCCCVTEEDEENGEE